MGAKEKSPKATAARKAAPSKPRRKAAPKVLPILKNDPWLEPYADAINGRHDDALRKRKELGGNLVDFANAHHYFGLHRNADGSWTLREWAPNATANSLVGDFSGWKENCIYSLRKMPG